MNKKIPTVEGFTILEEYRKQLRSVFNNTGVFEKNPTWSIKIKPENEWYEGMFQGNDNCRQFSYDKWKKLYKIKGIRTRGLSNSTENFNNPENKIQFHYWVETDKLVFDESGVRTLVAPKEEFYRFHDISDVEKSDHGVFFNNNFLLNCGPDSEEMIRNCTDFHSTRNIRLTIQNC